MKVLDVRDTVSLTIFGNNAQTRNTVGAMGLGISEVMRDAHKRNGPLCLGVEVVEGEDVSPTVDEKAGREPGFKEVAIAYCVDPILTSRTTVKLRNARARRPVGLSKDQW